MAKTIEQLEHEHDEAVRAREADLDARLRAHRTGATAEELSTLQAAVDRTSAAADQAGMALRDAEIDLDIDAYAELYGISREGAIAMLAERPNATGVIRDR